jgi:exosortase H (IPTLxxWG-CTERM-specific)
VLRFFFFFVTILLVLFYVELMNGVQLAVVAPWTAALAKISAVLLQIFDPTVRAYGAIIQNAHSGVGVKIEPGCNGVEACIVLISAILAFPARWRDKLIGIVLGVIAVQAVNVLRVISLFYLLQWSQPAFEFAHLYLWQALIMLDVLVVWLVWVRYIQRRAVPAVEVAS